MILFNISYKITVINCKGALFVRTVRLFCFLNPFSGVSMENLISSADLINEQLVRYGVKFGIYKNGTFNERLFPYDPIPRIIYAKDWEILSKGLVQRVTALNLFLSDIYSKKQIIADGVVPEDFVFSSSGYLAQVEGIVPPHQIYSHISGIDLVQAKDGSWFILEDNLRIPSGASYPLIARGLERKCSPQTFADNHIVDNRNYGTLLKDVLDDMNLGGINVVFTPGRFNAAYFEHAYLAEQTGSVLCQPEYLFVENNVVYCKTLNGKEKVGAIYRRISDEYLDSSISLWSDNLPCSWNQVFVSCNICTNCTPAPFVAGFNQPLITDL